MNKKPICNEHADASAATANAKGIIIDHADIVVTHTCPNRCPHCIDKFINTDSRIVSLSDIEDFLRIVSAHSSPGLEVLLLGGEPTSVGFDYLKDITEVIRSAGFSPIISTNTRDKEMWVKLVTIFDWVQITVHSKADIEFLKPYADKVNIKLAGDRTLTFKRLKEFIADTASFIRRSVSMYSTPDFTELCTDAEIWNILNGLDWKRNGSYLYAFYEGVRFKKCIHGETNIIDEPTVPKLYPNGHYNKTWCDEDDDRYLS